MGVNGAVRYVEACCIFAIFHPEESMYCLPASMPASIPAYPADFLRIRVTYCWLGGLFNIEFKAGLQNGY